LRISKHALKIPFDLLVKLNQSDYGLPIAHIISQYSNVLTNFIIILLLSSKSYQIVAVFGFAESLYNVFYYLSVGILSCAGIWLTETLSTKSHIKFTRQLVNMMLIVLFLTVLIFLILILLSKTRILFSLGTSFNDSVKYYFIGFSIGILPNILMIAITQIFSAIGSANMIIIGRAFKVITIPTLLKLSFSSSVPFSYLNLGITIGIGYILSAIFYIILVFYCFNKKNIKTNYRHIKVRIFCNKNTQEILNIMKTGIFSGILISLEALYLLAALFLINKFNIYAQSTYYIINSIIYAISTVPYAVSIALTYKIVIMKLDDTAIRIYIKKMYKFSFILVISMIAILFTIKPHIVKLFPSLKDTLITKELIKDFNIGYYLIAIYIILEIPRFTMIATLRSIKKTFSPMIINFICFWPLCLPLGVFFCSFSGLYVSSFISAEIIAVLLSILAHYYIYNTSFQNQFINA